MGRSSAASSSASIVQLRVLNLLSLSTALLTSAEVTIHPVRNSTGQLACTWSDEHGCYLDYFSFMPNSEIKDFYKLDEVCSKLRSPACGNDHQCQWDSGVCVARISQRAINDCTRGIDRKLGSLCSFMQMQTSCSVYRNSTACTLNDCHWNTELEGCTASEQDLMKLEFKGDSTQAMRMKDFDTACIKKSSRESCEALSEETGVSARTNTAGL